MRKISPQTVISAVFCALTIAVLGACMMSPTNLAEFLEDEKVQEIIGGKGIVNIITQSDDPADYSDLGLIAGNGIISGLDPNNYYMIQEYDEESNYLGLSFVSVSGSTIPDLDGIGKVSGKTITGLTNGYWYRVKSAKPLQGTANLYDQSTEPPPLSATPDSIPIDSDGIISPPPPNNDYYLNFPTTLIVFGSSDIVKIPIPGGQAENIIPFSGNTIALENGTETDYIFVEKDGSGNIIPGNFYFLKVLFSGPSGMVLTVTLAFNGDNSPDLSQSSYQYSQEEDDTITFEVENAAQYDDYSGSGINWYIDGVHVETGESFTLDKSTIEYKLVGVYTITVEATIGLAPYSAAIEVTVTP